MKSVAEMPRPEGKKHCLILGSGPSAGRLNWDTVVRDDVFTIFCNDQYLEHSLFFQPDVWLFADLAFTDKHFEGSKDLTFYTSHSKTTVVCSQFQFHRMMKGDYYFFGRPKLELVDLEKGDYYCRTTILTPALCLAVALGFQEITILGFDCRDHDPKYLSMRRDISKFRDWAWALGPLEKQFEEVKVYNASPLSIVNVFERGDPIDSCVSTANDQGTCPSR